MPAPRKIKFAAAIAAAPLLVAATGAATGADPYLWLEDIHGERALKQVETWNAATDKTLRAMPGFEADRAAAFSILTDESHIAAPGTVMGDVVTNLWRDKANPRGVWREASLASFTAGKPEWKTLIDVDALGKAEGKSWVWHGADCLAPEYVRCLVSLSPGGSDADVVREWNRKTGKFVEGGFSLPQAKSRVTWADADTLLVATDYGEGSLTTSGYPRILKRWKRGTPVTSASLVKEAGAQDMGLGVFTAMDGEVRRTFVTVNKSFYTKDMWVEGKDGKLIALPLPESADFEGLIDGKLIAFLNKPLGTHPAGALVSWTLADILAGKPGEPVSVYAPEKSQAIESVTTTDHALWIKLLDDVSGRLLQLVPRDETTWSVTTVALPDNATISLDAAADKADMAFVTAQSFLQPPTLYAVDASGTPKALQSLPAKFDASAFTLEQHFATSKDGTRVPYFLARKKGTSGPVPALVHAYGGFRAAQTPTYLTTEPYRAGPLAMFWVSDGNAYVLANIRGGGEYGPAWHDAALRENRQRAYEDLYAVSEDLVARGISARGKIAVSGRSNGGLMAGVALTQRPDLYGAAIIGSPLLDMKRYSHMLAGASWMAEYGDPDVPGDWAFIKTYSPYQNVKKGTHYPAPFFYLSTEDDRVHPGHARKMAAELEAYGNPVFYHEYREGGHSVGADPAEDAVRAAMLHAYLKYNLEGVRPAK